MRRNEIFRAAAFAAWAGAVGGLTLPAVGQTAPGTPPPASGPVSSAASPAGTRPASRASEGPASAPAVGESLVAARAPTSNPDAPVEQLHEALRLLQAGRYADADRLATALASAAGSPLPRAWLVAAQARQDLRLFPAAAEAYRSFLAGSDTSVGREYAARQLRLCEAADVPKEVAAPPSTLLAAEDKALLAAVEDREFTQTGEHFVVHARNEELARLVARDADKALARICGYILGGGEYPHRVEVRVWTDRRDYLAHAAGAQEWSGGGFSFSREGGAVQRRIDLAQLDEKKAFSTALLDRVLPHEMCHLVVTELFGDAPCPLYLGEGLAMLAEWDVDSARLGLAGTALAGRGRIPLADLLVVEAGRLDKPDLFYAESYSLLHYLRQRLDDKQFAALIEHVKNGSPLAEALQRALHAPEDPDFLKNLEAAWQKHAIDQAQYLRALRPGTQPGR